MELKSEKEGIHKKFRAPTPLTRSINVKVVENPAICILLGVNKYLKILGNRGPMGFFLMRTPTKNRVGLRSRKVGNLPENEIHCVKRLR